MAIYQSMQDNVFDRADISVVGKVFLAAIASAALGRPSNVRVKGNPDQVEAIRAALAAAHALRVEIDRPGATVQDVMDKLQVLRAAAATFEDMTGLPWPA